MKTFFEMSLLGTTYFLCADPSSYDVIYSIRVDRNDSCMEYGDSQRMMLECDIKSEVIEFKQYEFVQDKFVYPLHPKMIEKGKIKFTYLTDEYQYYFSPVTSARGRGRGRGRGRCRPTFRRAPNRFIVVEYAIYRSIYILPDELGLGRKFFRHQVKFSRNPFPWSYSCSKTFYLVERNRFITRLRELSQPYTKLLEDIYYSRKTEGDHHDHHDTGSVFVTLRSPKLLEMFKDT